jgi:energy-coupling factor transport system substrate-specific component
MDGGLLMILAGMTVLGGAYLVLARTLSSKELAVTATMAALSAAGRVAFAPIPSVQPSTVLIIISGWVLGPAAGFLVGATTAFASNFFLGQGPWTIWQMVAWGVIGAAAGFLGRARPRRAGAWILALSVVSGFFFSWLMDVWMWLSFVYPHTLGSLLVTVGVGLWFDVLHAGGNAVFALLLAPRAVAILERFHARMRVEYVGPGPAAVAADA